MAAGICDAFTVRILTNCKHDVELLHSFLQQPQVAVSSTFLRSNALRAGLEYRADRPYHADYYVAERMGPKGKEVAGVMAHCWNGNVIQQVLCAEALSVLCTAFCNQALRPVRGVVGPLPAAAQVVAAIGLEGDDAPRPDLRSEESLWVLPMTRLTWKWTSRTRNGEDAGCGYTKAVNAPLQAWKCGDHHFEVVEARRIDHTLLQRWMRIYARETFNARPTTPGESQVDGHSETHDQNALHSDNEEEEVQRSDVGRLVEEGARAWVLLVDDIACSLCGFNAWTPDTVQIGPVFTPAHLRGRGYARTLLALVLHNTRSTSAVQRAVLFTDNPIAERVYTALGFQKEGGFLLHLLGEDYFMSPPPPTQ